jgi:two-component system cell cycle sensor histidine kinase PleC
LPSLKQTSRAAGVLRTPFLSARQSRPGVLRTPFLSARQSRAGPVDPRLLKTRVERGVEGLRSGAIGGPLWIGLAAILTSSLVGAFGEIDPNRALRAVAPVIAASLVGLAAVHRFARLGACDARTTGAWFWRALALTLLMSSAWGLAPWLLWQNGNLANHLFLALIALAAGGRFLVSRAAPIVFFTAGFAPMALLLLARLLAEGGTPELILAGLLAVYGAHAAFDVWRHSLRLDAEAGLRFANEDLTRALQQARDQALSKHKEAEKASHSKTVFLANMSHELRTPLNAILGFSEIISREALGPLGSPRYREYAVDIHDSGAHLLSLIDELLDVAKIEAGRMEIAPGLIDTKPMLENTLRLLAIRARERRQALSFKIAADAGVLHADERAFKQIVINLVANAIKFTQKGGRIDVSARRTAEGDFLLVVADNGPGIPKDKLDLVFTPFAREDNRYDRKAPGTGLGLALVRGLAELHGGRSWIESGTGKGTRVHVVLPMSERAAARTAAE